MEPQKTQKLMSSGFQSGGHGVQTTALEMSHADNDKLGASSRFASRFIKL